MSTGLAGIGPKPTHLMILGERPGPEDWEDREAFVSQASNELFARIWKVLRLNKDDVYCTYLFDRFTGMEFDPRCLSEQYDRVRKEILRVRPTCIAVLGYHGARFLLPELRGMNGDFFHGKAFAYTYGRLQPRTTTMVPLAHLSSALTQPDRYQNQLTRDLECVRDVLAGDGVHHRVKRPDVYQVGLASYCEHNLLLGSDTEGSVRQPECITLARGTGSTDKPSPHVACIETWEHGKAVPFTKASMENAAAIVFHYAIHDLKVLRTLGITHFRKVHDTMIGAYLLDLPQSLKVLAWRELGYVMSEYADLVEPLDVALVRSTLLRAAERWAQRHKQLLQQAEKIETTLARVKKKKRVTKKAIAARYKSLQAKNPSLPPLRVVTGVVRMIERTDEAAAHAEID